MTDLRTEPLDASDRAPRRGAGAGEPTAGGPVAADAAQPADRASWARFLGIAAVVTTLDQLTKAWLTSFLAPGRSVDVLGDVVRLVHSQNSGGLFGLFRGQAVVFGLVSLVVVGLIVLYHARAGRGAYLSITLGLLLGGALGNLIDRFRLGYVVDFVDAGLGDLRWYTFNVADTAISFSLLLLLAAGLWPALARRPAGDA